MSVFCPVPFFVLSLVHEILETPKHSGLSREQWLKFANKAYACVSSLSSFAAFRPESHSQGHAPFGAS